jgi:hypothetical protein
LRAYTSCFKCCRFNAGHGSSSCLCTGFPSSAGYKTITKQADATELPAMKPITDLKGKVVASTFEEVTSDDDDVVAAFGPSASLGNGTDSRGSDTISDIAPLKCKHFIWKCTIDGPLLEFPLAISSLINNNCHLVFIRLELIQKLGLPIFNLESSETIEVAIKDCKQKKKIELSNFVILSATSFDQKWSSKHVHAIITPNLCMPVIFRLLFLEHNNIVIDHSLCSCIDKKTDYDLINPKFVLPPLLKLFPPTKRKLLAKQKKNN